MLLISFSASTQWWQCYNIFTWGMLAIVLFDKFMLTKKFSTKILCSIGIFISGISYIFYFYPTWQVPYGYIYLAVLIWVVIKNWKEYKINKKDILLIIAIILAIGAILGIYFVKSADDLKLITGTDYPGKRFETGGKEIKTMEELNNIKNSHQIGDSLTIKVNRNGKELDLTVILQEQ